MFVPVKAYRALTLIGGEVESEACRTTLQAGSSIPKMIMSTLNTNILTCCISIQRTVFDTFTIRRKREAWAIRAHRAKEKYVGKTEIFCMYLALSQLKVKLTSCPLSL